MKDPRVTSAVMGFTPRRVKCKGTRVTVRPEALGLATLVIDNADLGQVTLTMAETNLRGLINACTAVLNEDLVGTELKVVA